MKKQFMQGLLIIMMSVCLNTSAIFDPMPGDQLWSMINQIGLINQTIAGCVMPITANDIGSTGFIITEPGNYSFIQDVNYTGVGVIPAINISVSDVALDLNNFTLSTANSSAVLISVASGVSNVVIRNAHLTGGLHSIQLIGTNSYVAIANVSASGAAAEGILIGTGASNIACNEILSQQHGTHGMSVSGTNDSIAVLNSRFVSNTGNGLFIQGTNHIYVAKCSAITNTLSGFNMDTGSNLLMYLCHGSNNTVNGISINGITNAIVSDITTQRNQNVGTGCANLSGLQLSNLNSDLDAHGIQLADNTGVVLENIIISRAENNGIFVNGTVENDSLYKNITIYAPLSDCFNFSDEITLMVIENANLFDPKDASGTAVDGYGLNFQFDTHEIILRDIEILQPANIGIYFSFGTLSTDILMEDVCITDASRNVTISISPKGGIYFDAFAQRASIYDSQVIANNGNGISFASTSTALLIQNCIALDQDASNNSQIDGFGRGISIDTFNTTIDFDLVEIDNCFLIGNVLDGIAVTGNVNTSITENTIIDNARSTVASNGITLGTSQAAAFFSYVGFNDLIFNTSGGGFNVQQIGSSLFGRYDVGIAGNFSFCASGGCTFDTTPGGSPSRVNAAFFNVVTGWIPNSGSAAGAHWQNVACHF